MLHREAWSEHQPSTRHCWARACEGDTSVHHLSPQQPHLWVQALPWEPGLCRLQPTSRQLKTACALHTCVRSSLQCRGVGHRWELFHTHVTCSWPVRHPLTCEAGGGGSASHSLLRWTVLSLTTDSSEFRRESISHPALYPGITSLPRSSVAHSCSLPPQPRIHQLHQPLSPHVLWENQEETWFLNAPLHA